MPERQPKPLQRMKESGKEQAEAAMLYFTALAAVPSLLLLSLRIRNPRKYDITLKTLREGSYHDALYDTKSDPPEGYVPAGATVSVEGLGKPVLIEEMRTGAWVYIGKRGQDIQPHYDNFRIPEYSYRFYVNPHQKFGYIGDTGIEVEHLPETKKEVDAHYK